MLNYKYTTSKKLSATKTSSNKKPVNLYRNVPTTYANLFFESKKLTAPKRPEYLHDEFGNLTW